MESDIAGIPQSLVCAIAPRIPRSLSIQWFSASFRCFVIPIVQQVVIEHGITDIESHNEYGGLRAAKASSENRLMQKFQETCNYGGRALRNRARKLVMPFFQEENGKDPVLQKLTCKIFGVPVDAGVLVDKHPVAQALCLLPSSESDCPVCVICMNFPLLIGCVCRLPGEKREQYLFETEKNASGKR